MVGIVTAVRHEGIIEATGKLREHEIVNIGVNNILGEVVKQCTPQNRKPEYFIIRIYTNDWKCIRVEDRVSSLGKSLEIPLGPAMLGKTFDALLNPLAETDKTFYFEPHLRFGDVVCENTHFGNVPSKADGKLIVLKELEGRVTFISSAGTYTTDDTLLIVEDSRQQVHQFSFMQSVKLRTPNEQVYSRKNTPRIYTGIRTIDICTPIHMSQKIVLLGNQGTGKTSIATTICNNTSFDVIVYVTYTNSSSKINQLTQHPFLQRAVIIAATANSAEKAKLLGEHTGYRVAKYFEKLGLFTLVVHDDLLRSLDDFKVHNYAIDHEFKMAQEITTIFCVTDQDIREYYWYQNNDVLISLDQKMAQSRSFPAISYNTNYRTSEYHDGKQLQQIFSYHNDLDEIIALVGVESLADEDKVAHRTIKLVKEVLLEQDISEPFCSEQKLLGMMRNLLYYYNFVKTLKEQHMHYVKNFEQELLSQKLVVCDGTEEQILSDLYDRMKQTFRMRPIWDDLERIRTKEGTRELQNMHQCSKFFDATIFANTNSLWELEQKCINVYDEVNPEVVKSLVNRLGGTELEYLL
jgi:vacuolar-type H+-ATPase catalytic subunit A/Vma1